MCEVPPIERDKISPPFKGKERLPPISGCYGMLFWVQILSIEDCILTYKHIENEGDKGDEGIVPGYGLQWGEPSLSDKVLAEEQILAAAKAMAQKCFQQVKANDQWRVEKLAEELYCQQMREEAITSSSQAVGSSRAHSHCKYSWIIKFRSQK